MRYVLVLALVGVMGCGGDEDSDCYDEVRANGKTYCVPGPNAGKSMCLRYPEPEGLGKACDFARERGCPEEALMLIIRSGNGEVRATCDCDDADVVCDGTPG